MNIVGVEIGRQTSGRAASEKDGLGGTEVVLLCQRLEHCVDDPLSTEVDFFAVDFNRLVGVSGKGITIAVRQVYAVEVAVVLICQRKDLYSATSTVETGEKQDS